MRQCRCIVYILVTWPLLGIFGLQKRAPTFRGLPTLSTVVIPRVIKASTCLQRQHRRMLPARTLSPADCRMFYSVLRCSPHRRHQVVNIEQHQQQRRGNNNRGQKSTGSQNGAHILRCCIFDLTRQFLLLPKMKDTLIVGCEKDESQSAGLA